jgi:hypothetical protein
MKRIAALAGGTTAALAISGFAFSGTALASTGDWGPPQGGSFSCVAPSQQPPNWWSQEHSTYQRYNNSWYKRHHHKLQACVTFSVDSGSFLFNEVAGPQLQPGNGLYYQGQILTVATVSGSTFTVTDNGASYCNDGNSVNDAVAMLVDSYDYGWGWGQSGSVQNG